MSQSINLIPQEEKQEQRKEKIVKFSSIVSVLLLVLVGAIAGFLWYRDNNVKSMISQKEAEIESHRTDIASLSDVEVLARELDAKYNTLVQFSSDKRNYSILFRELSKRVPDTVSISKLSIAGENRSQLNLSGQGLNYIEIARLVENLSNTDYSAADDSYKELFSNVTLSSINLDSQDLSVAYSILVDFNSNMLQNSSESEAQ